MERMRPRSSTLTRCTAPVQATWRATERATGSSQSSITVDARNPNNQPVRGLSMRVDMFVNGVAADFGTLSARTVVTGDDGRARVVYTAPPRPLDGGDGQLLTIGFVPIGTDYSNAVRRTVDIKLIPPGVILPPNNAPVPSFTFSPSAPTTFQAVFFDASGTAITVVDPRAPQEGRLTMSFADDPVQLRQWEVTTKTGQRTRVALTALRPGGSFERSLFNIELAAANYR